MNVYKFLTVAASAAISVSVYAGGFSASKMTTEWGEKVTPENAWREYPRPQMARANWTCLNGTWDYAVYSNNVAGVNSGRIEKCAEGKILVPFAIESALSGVGRLLEPGETLVYTRTFDAAPKAGKRLLLNFEAVDYRAQVFVNGVEAGVPHDGGSNAFSYDITDLVKAGVNELKVKVWDPTETFIGGSAKQMLRPSGCFYTRVSGIWQTVWLEEVPETYIRSCRITPDIDRGEVKFEVEVEGEGERKVLVSAFDGDRKLGDFTPLSTSAYSLRLDSFECWSPENPKLYTFTAKCGADEVKGHFAMRKFAKGTDKDGHLRFFLNNKPYFILGTLDQGWWPDGLLTPPSVEAMMSDVKVLKDCGFNMLRKHIKVEPRIFYAECDRLGILVLQDMPSSDWHADANEMMKRYGKYRVELKEMIDELYNVPSIVMWVPYNESWGQPSEDLTLDTLRWTKRYDPTRLVDGPSGWNDYWGGLAYSERDGKWTRERTTEPAAPFDCGADTVDLHEYRGPGMIPSVGGRISFLGEFGGLGHPVEGHLWKTDADGNWGYGGIDDTKTREGLEKTYLGLMTKLGELAGKGLAGSVYTQTTDVEIEINGLMSYDRKVLKFDPAVLKAAHEKVIGSVK